MFCLLATLLMTTAVYSDNTQCTAPSSIEVIDLSPDTPLHPALHGRRTAALIRNSAAAEWAANLSSGWLDELASSHTMLHHASMQPTTAPLFGNYDSSPASLSLKEVFPAPFAEHSMRVSELVASGEQLRYWSGDPTLVGLSGAAELWPQLEPCPGGETIGRAWIGSKGVVAGAHYDNYHNSFCQLIGEKRFRLLPPQHLSEVYLHPALHPRYRGSQLSNLSDVDRRKYPLFKGQPLVVTVKPGEVLYLPPMWLHQVESLVESLGTPESHLSASFSMWCHDTEVERAEGVFGLAVPFEQSWSTETTRTALRRYLSVPHLPFATCCVRHTGILDSTAEGVCEIQVLALAVLGDDGAVDGLWRSLVSRYTTLLPPSGSHLLRPQLEQGYCGTEGAVPGEARWGAAAERVVEHLRGLELPVQQLYLEDLAEQLIAFFVGKYHVMAFLQTCVHVIAPEQNTRHI